MTTTLDWDEITTISHFDTVSKIKGLIDEQEYEEAREGLERLEESMSISQQRSLESQLIRLMFHIIKWQLQPQKRSKSWALTIANARIEIRGLRKYKPSLNKIFIEKIWQDCFDDAIIEARAEMGLSRKDSFEPCGCQLV